MASLPKLRRLNLTGTSAFETVSPKESGAIYFHTESMNPPDLIAIRQHFENFGPVESVEFSSEIYEDSPHAFVYFNDGIAQFISTEDARGALATLDHTIGSGVFRVSAEPQPRLKSLPAELLSNVLSGQNLRLKDQLGMRGINSGWNAKMGAWLPDIVQEWPKINREFLRKIRVIVGQDPDKFHVYLSRVVGTIGRKMDALVFTCDLLSFLTSESDYKERCMSTIIRGCTANVKRLVSYDIPFPQNIFLGVRYPALQELKLSYIAWAWPEWGTCSVEPYGREIKTKTY